MGENRTFPKILICDGPTEEAVWAFLHAELLYDFCESPSAIVKQGRLLLMEFMLQAVKAFQANDPKACLDYLAKSGTDLSGNGQALLLAALSHRKIENWQQAAAFYRQAAEAMPEKHAQFAAAAEELQAMAGTGQPASEQTDLPQSLSTNLTDRLLSEAEISSGPISGVVEFYRAGAFAKAVQLFETLLAENAVSSVHIAHLVLLSYCYRETGNLAKAAHYLGHAAKQDGQRWPLLLNLALGLFRQLYDETGEVPQLGYETARLLASLEPRNVRAAIYYRLAMQDRCEIEDLRAYNEKALEGLRNGDRFYQETETLHNNLFWCADEALNASINPKLGLTPFTEEARKARQGRPHVFGEKIRVGYLTSDLMAKHPTSILFKGVLAAHDRARFEITLYCTTPSRFNDEDLQFRKELPGLVEISHLSADEAKADMQRRGIDILVDLKGPTAEARSDIVNAGPAPIQVAYLGFPGSGTGIDCDYIISDAIVTPNTSKPHYLEKLCRLPETYQCNDNRTRPHPAPASREALGLAQEDFLFSGFNNMHKFSPQIIDIWAEILKRADNAKFVLLGGGAVREMNFLDAMARHGLGPDRFIFWPKADYADHLARIPATDLGLDCHPYNGHTTTSDMLWAGLPVLTFKGSNFASRVSESLLNAIGLPDLVCDSPQSFVETAVALARNPATLKTLRQHFTDNRFKAPLFNTDRFTRHLERAFEMMVERHKAGLKPDHMDVPALP